MEQLREALAAAQEEASASGLELRAAMTWQGAALRTRLREGTNAAAAREAALRDEMAELRAAADEATRNRLNQLMLRLIIIIH